MTLNNVTQLTSAEVWKKNKTEQNIAQPITRYALNSDIHQMK